MVSDVSDEFSFDVGYVLDPSMWVIRSLIASKLVLNNDVRVLIAPRTKTRLENEFTAVSQLAELQSNDEIRVRVVRGSDMVNENVLVTEDAAGSYISTGDNELFVGSDDIETDVLFDFVRELWENADPVSFSTPTETEVFQRVVDVFSRDVYRDFWELNREFEAHGVDNVYSDYESSVSRTHVYVSLIVAGAISGVEVTDMIDVLSELWGVSESAFSRYGQELSELGVVEIQDGGELTTPNSMDSIDLDKIVLGVRNGADGCV